MDPKATTPNSQSPNFLVAVRSTLRKSGLQPFNAKGAGHGDSCVLPVTWIELRAPNDVRGQVQLIAGITQGKALIERGGAPSHFAIDVDIGTEQVAEPPIVTEVPRQLARDQRIVDAAQVGGVVDADLDQGARYQELHSAAEDRPRGRPSDDRNIDSETIRRRHFRSVAPVPGIDEIETLQEVERRTQDPPFRQAVSPSRRGPRRQYRATARSLPPTLQTCWSFCISLDIGVPWRDSVPLQSIPA